MALMDVYLFTHQLHAVIETCQNLTSSSYCLLWVNMEMPPLMACLCWNWIVDNQHTFDAQKKKMDYRCISSVIIRYKCVGSTIYEILYFFLDLNWHSCCHVVLDKHRQNETKDKKKQICTRLNTRPHTDIWWLKSTLRWMNRKTFGE